GEEAAAERAVGHQGDAEFAAGGELAAGFRVAGPQRILALDGGKRMNGMRPADGRGRRLAKADVANLARLDQPGHGADGVLDQYGWIDAVDQVEVDDVDAEAAQAAFAGDGHVVRPATDAERVAGLVTAGIAELGDDEGVVPAPADDAADEFLVLACAVGVR